MTYSNVADLTVDELKNLIREVVTQTIVEIFGDPDEGLELQEEIKERLHRSLATTQTGAKLIPAQDVAAKLGLVHHPDLKFGFLQRESHPNF